MSLWWRFDVASMSPWSRFDIALMSLWCRFDVALMSLWCRFDAALMSLWSYVDVTVMSLWCRSDVALMSLLCRFEVALMSLWCITLMLLSCVAVPWFEYCTLIVKFFGWGCRLDNCDVYQLSAFCLDEKLNFAVLPLGKLGWGQFSLVSFFCGLNQSSAFFVMDELIFSYYRSSA